MRHYYSLVLKCSHQQPGCSSSSYTHQTSKHKPTTTRSISRTLQHTTGINLKLSTLLNSTDLQILLQTNLDTLGTTIRSAIYSISIFVIGVAYIQIGYSTVKQSIWRSSLTGNIRVAPTVRNREAVKSQYSANIFR